MNYVDEIEYVVEQIKKYYEQFETKKAILGISGGKDSTICTMLLIKAIGKENVYGVMMPNGDQKDIVDSKAICKTLGIQNETNDISTCYHAVINNSFYPISDISKTNILPRIRMTILRAIGQSMGAKLICTGNSSELFIGWCTLDGDMASDNIAPLLPYTCIEVIEMGKILAKEFGLDEKYIIKVPADGLTNSSDEDNFGFTYQNLHDYERIGTTSNKNVDKKIKLKHDSTNFKRRRKTIPYKTLEEIQRMDRCC